MGMCCKKKIMIGSMKWRVPGQEVDERKLAERLWKKTKARGLNMEDATDRSRWRRQIGMIDDHNECEWVTDSSSTGLPGLSRTNSKEP